MKKVQTIFESLSSLNGYNLMFAIYSVSKNNGDVPSTSQCTKQITFDGLIYRVHGSACFPNKMSIVKKRKVKEPKGEYKFMII